MTDVDRFIERFSEVWKSPQPQDFAELFTSNGTLFHPTMERPIGAADVPDYVRRIKALVPDITLEVENWAARGDVVLIEWTITATFGGERILWKGADRFTLEGDKAKEGVAYFDTLPFWARLDPSLAKPPIESALSAASPSTTA